MIRLKYILYMIVVMLIALLSSGNMYSQEVRTSAPDEIYEGEIFSIQYDIVSYDPIESKPELVGDKNFEQVGQPEISYSRPSLFWGADYYRMRVSYNLKPKKTGMLDLPQIKLAIAGQTVESSKEKIVIHKLLEKENVTCFVKVDQTKTSVSVGDTLTVTYKLYTTKAIERILDLSTARINDFYYQDLTPRKLEYTEEELDGVVYKVYVIRKLRLQSLRQGEREFPEGSLEIEYAYPTGREKKDRWGRTYEEYLRESQSCVIEPFTIRVRDMMAI